MAKCMGYSGNYSCCRPRKEKNSYNIFYVNFPPYRDSNYNILTGAIFIITKFNNNNNIKVYSKVASICK